MVEETLTGDQAAAAVTGWLPVLGGLEACFLVPDLAAATGFADAVAGLPDADRRIAHLTLTARTVRVRLRSASASGTTALDVDLAHRVGELADRRGLVTSTARVQRLEVGLDTADVAAARAFWLAVLGLPDDGRPDEVVDVDGVLPALWFQPTDAHDEPRQRFHLDLWVSPDEVDARVDAALRAGGRLVSDAAAPAFRVLADPEGNKVCLCTYRDRPA